MLLPNDDEMYVSRESEIMQSRPDRSVFSDSFPAPLQAPPDRPWKVFPEERTVHPGDGVVSTRSNALARFSRKDTVQDESGGCREN